MKSPITSRIGAVGLAAATVLASGLVTLAGAVPGVGSAAEAATAGSLTITPNPAAAGQPFQGWGTSLAWFANATGDYPAALRNQLYDALFGKDGLDLNIARYNIGGGNASDVSDYLRPGGAVQGYWKPDATGSDGTYGGTATTLANKSQVLSAWDPSDDADYDWSADATQRWWLDQLAQDKQITHWEAFANSAPYFMTQSGYVSGNTNASTDNLNPAAYDKFAGYLTHVVDHLEQQYGVSFDSIEPFNEPNTSYWGTTLTNGVPNPGGQEGMHVSATTQPPIVTALKTALGSATTKAGIAAMDETNTSTFLTDWAAYDAAHRADVDRMNVHSYGTANAVQVRDAAKAAKKPLWMSEVEGSWVNGYDPTNIANGLGLAQKINDDLRTLQPEAWTLWQPVENFYNMQKTEKLNWGEVYVDFDCKPYDVDGTTTWKSAQRVADAGGDPSQAPDCGIEYSSKYNAMRSYTHFIHEGDKLVPTNDTTSTAAIGADGTGASIVHTNATAAAQTITVDLSDFGTVAADATVTPYVTTQGSSATDPDTDALVKGTAVAVDPATKTATLTVPADSITSFVVSGVSGVAGTAPGLVDGHTYQLVGAQSGKALTAATSGTTATTITTPATSAAAAGSQAWTAHAVPGSIAGDSGAEFVLTTADGKVLGATSAGTDLRSVSVSDAVNDPADRWMPETTDGATYSLVNESLSQALDVGGQASADNSPVGVYGSNNGTNQAWTARDVVPTGVTTVALHTKAGVAPTLPATAAPVYAWGTGAAVPVTWDTPPATTWATPGQVSVTGTATDVFGHAFTVRASVDVGDFTTVDPASIAVPAGASVADLRAAAPVTVSARVGGSDQTFSLPVSWDLSSVSADDLADAGSVVTATGTVDDGSGTSLPATLWVLVTTPGSSNIAPSATASASSTEGSYSAANTINGVLTDKGWSNWVSSNKPAQSTLTYTFATAHTLQDAKVYFYKDGVNTWAQSLQFQYQDPTSGAWLPVPGYESAVPVDSPADGSAPIVTATFATPITTTGLKVVMNAYSGGYLTVSEVQADELQATATDDTDLGAIRVGAQQVAGVSGDVHSYTVQNPGAAYPTVQGFAIDPSATVKVTQPSAATDGTATIVVTSADGSASTTYTVAVQRAVALTSVGVSGPVEAGRTVHAAVAVDPADADLTYQWYAGDTAIADATGDSYAIPAGTPVGASYSVAVTAGADGFLGTPTLRSATVQVQPDSTDSTLADLKIGGQPVAGFASSVTSYDYTSSTGEFPVVSASAASAAASVVITQPSVATDGLATVAVTAGDGSSTTTYTVQVTRTASVSAVAITPAPRVGTAVRATATTSPADGAVSYAWSVGGEPVAKATAASYTPRPQDAGKPLTVTVTVSGSHLVPATETSAAATVAPGSIGGVGTPAISGILATGQTVSAVTGGLAAGDTVSYQWYADGSPIGGATSASLALTKKLAGKRLRVLVTVVRPGYDGQSATSATTARVAKAHTPKVRGAARVGARLRVKTGKWTKGTRFAYQWYAGGKAIHGAHRATYVVRAADRGKRLSVVVTGTKHGYATVSLHSKAGHAVKR